MRKKTFRLISIPIISFVVLLFIAITVACSIMRNEITLFLCPPKIDTEAANAATAEGEELSAKIMAEGAVLVKNENKTLPLKRDDTPKVNVFGWASIPNAWVAGGFGSGRVRSTETDSSRADVGLIKALNEYGVKSGENGGQKGTGIETNTELTKMYESFYNSRRPEDKYREQDKMYAMYEPDISTDDWYTPALKESAKAFSDTALVVLGRTGSEQTDQSTVQYLQEKASKGDSFKAVTDESRHGLEISKYEESLLRYVGATYKNTIVIINSTNTMELGFLDTIEGLDACLIVGGTGMSGATAIPPLLYGEQSPSGRTADIYPYAFESNVNYHHTNAAGLGRFTNVESGSVSGWTSDSYYYVDYIENIYVGYRWYETADKMDYWKDVNNEYGKGYDGIVQFPFGHGLSYTSFDWTVQEVTPSPGTELKKDDKITVKVRVTNTGDVAGQEVVQLYYTAPYTTDGIEKSHVNLCAFAKTPEPVEPGDNQVLTLEFNARDMASYDCYGKNGGDFTGYELEGGTYELKLMTDSHTVKTVDFDAAVGGKTEQPGIIGLTVPAAGFRYDTDAQSGNAVSNKFTGADAIDLVPVDGSTESEIPYISRASFPATYQKEADRPISDSAKDASLYTKADAEAWDNSTTDCLGEPVEVGAYDDTVHDSGLRLTKTNAAGELEFTEECVALGGDYGDQKKWDALLSQMTFAQMKDFVKIGSLTTAGMEPIGLPQVVNLDGPAQISGFSSLKYRTVGYPTPTVMAQTFNTDLIRQFGTALGKEGVTRGVTGWLGPAVNIHRNPFGGRNFEYYSEDPVLSGKMAAAAIIGSKNAGMYAYLKHFVLNDQESARGGAHTYTTEQALREIYLKPFQIAVQEGGATGIMTSYNRIGSVWTGGSEALVTGVLRHEWGFTGAVIMDYNSVKQSYMSIDQAIRAGGDRNMGYYASFQFSTDSNRMRHAIRNSMKNYLYLYANTVYQNRNPVASDALIERANVIPTFEWWIPLLVVLDVVVFLGCGVWTFFVIRKKDKTKKETVLPADDAPQA